MLRIIELYNTRFGTTRTGRYKVAAGTLDGFAADPEDATRDIVTEERHHTADFNQDGQISLPELLRVVELYNVREGTQRTGRYRSRSGTIDGFATGVGGA